ncbi:hypothetical protein [Bailinhaonella thermotolerans]|uniref:Uncharacterized protein n=1 Tax=Bailinhaonella thermotolerans TaxID=1070861 RepID=A0A3A4AKI5_9ACTN|nr:hypothetical protein [Bailinhaonella thermotolerans]RJL19284.1 hypothetical protein D5H75_40550 [Bailinhaonella thermotolerans]
MTTFEMAVTASSNPNLNQADFDRQVAMIKPVMSWDAPTKTWYAHLNGARPEHLSSVLNTLFEAARQFGTSITVRLKAAEPAPSSPADPEG